MDFNKQLKTTRFADFHGHGWVSGDGVDEDDYVTNGGAVGFEAPAAIRADQVTDQGVRLPYFKFPRNPAN